MSAGETLVLAVACAPGAAMGLYAAGSLWRERRDRERRKREAGHLSDLLKLGELVPSDALREHYEARLDEAVGGFCVRDVVLDPEVRALVEGHLDRRSGTEGREDRRRRRDWWS